MTKPVKGTPEWDTWVGQKISAAHARSPKVVCQCGVEYARRAYVYHARYCGTQCQADGCSNPQQNMFYCKNHYPVYRLARKFKTTFDELYAFILASDYCCQICGTALEIHGSSAYGEKTACIDHCHSSMKVRGVLCQKCNVLLGYADDSPSLLRAMAEYIESGVDLRPPVELRAEPFSAGNRFGNRWDPQGPECKQTGCPEPRLQPHSRCKLHAKIHRLAAKHGLTAEIIESVISKNDGKCPICENTILFMGKLNMPLRMRTHFDHEHSTGRVRGIICGRCNSALPYAQDDPARLRAAADYLERNS